MAVKAWAFFILFLAAYTYAQFAGGEGTSESPFQIQTLEHLHMIRNHMSSYFVLINDLDFTGSPYAGSQGGWVPVGSRSKPFEGVLDGNEYVISNLYIKSDSSYATGLFAYNEGVIRNCILQNVTIRGYKTVGGFAGENRGRIYYCSVSGNVGGVHQIGGIVGRNLKPGEISYSYTTAMIHGQTDCGGLIGHQGGFLKDCYFTGEIRSKSLGGALAGENRGTIRRCYALGKNPLVASNHYEKPLKNCYSEGKHDLKKRCTFRNWDFINVWALDKNKNNGYPYILAGSERELPSCNHRSTEAPCFMISNPDQLQEMRYSLNAHYVLANNIDASETRNWNGGKGFIPIGTKDSMFTGTFDGQGYVIENLHINSDTTDIGLFGYIGCSAIVENLTLSHARISGKYRAGAIVACNRGGLIRRCTVTGRVKSSFQVGGIAGWNREGRVLDCFSAVSIVGDGAMGAIAGKNDGHISGCLGAADLKGKKDVGGIVGMNVSGRIENCSSQSKVFGELLNVGGIAGWNKGLINLCYAAGQLSGGKSIGGIVGENVSDSVKASFWSEGIATGIGSGTGQSLDSARSRKKSTYTSKGWDFDSSWSIDAEINSGLPYLKHVPFVSANNYQGDSIHPHLIRKSEVKCITSSSVYSGKHKYSPENIMDGNLSTAWIEGVAGNGEEQWVEIEFTQPQDIQEIIIVNGYTKSFRIYAANNRVKNLLITATTESGRIERNIALRNVSFHGAMPVAGERVAGFEGIVKVRFQIKSIYKGSKYEDTGISEVLFLKG